MLLFVFLWANGLDANEIHSEMRPVYGDKCFWADKLNARWAEIRIRGAINRSSVAWTTASIVLCIGHSEAC